MLVYIQWARRNPQDYSSLGSEGWATSPSKPDPSRGSAYALNELNNAPGWVAELSVQGVAFKEDHYHVADIPDGSGGIVITTWTDTQPWIASDGRYARVWTISTLAPDSKHGGALNTRQSEILYCEEPLLSRVSTVPVENRVIRPWAEFAAPPAVETRHGIWLTDAAWQAHAVVRTQHGWREWGI